MLNAFTETQLQVIRDLAGQYWDGVSSKDYALSISSMDKLREQYIGDIIDGLVDPAIWGE